ncbi:hypothetical protein GCM10007111_37230 [Virgibacillus kapii]|uniref:Uncharacterized protein n=1 Tax=Virgibacillus kapii TaxID=1638645 RepID=A0ABQ2DSZ6_9BACI|nr:hypothetical protein GCM10007111_37230 [Virgibacillus kapii]
MFAHEISYSSSGKKLKKHLYAHAYNITYDIMMSIKRIGKGYYHE